VNYEVYVNRSDAVSGGYRRLSVLAGSVQLPDPEYLFLRQLSLGVLFSIGAVGRAVSMPVVRVLLISTPHQVRDPVIRPYAVQVAAYHEWAGLWTAEGVEDEPVYGERPRSAVFDQTRTRIALRLVLLQNLTGYRPHSIPTALGKPGERPDLASVAHLVVRKPRDAFPLLHDFP